MLCISNQIKSNQCRHHNITKKPLELLTKFRSLPGRKFQIRPKDINMCLNIKGVNALYTPTSNLSMFSNIISCLSSVVSSVDKIRIPVPVNYRTEVLLILRIYLTGFDANLLLQVQRKANNSEQE
jgi:hypothetical protein